MTDALTHATTVPHPLAWAAAAGYCPVLMSDTRPPMEREGQLIGIHASARTWTVEEWRTHFDRLVAMKLSPPTVYPRGALIGVARLVGVVTTAGLTRFVQLRGRAIGAADELDARVADRIRPWWRSGSKWGLFLTDAVLLPESIPMRGAGGVWRINHRAHAPVAPGASTCNCPACRALEQWRQARGA